MVESQPKFRLRTSQVAYLAGVEQVRLQGWLDRDNVFLDGIAERPGDDKHRRYSVMDAVRIAIIGRLLAHTTMTAKQASGFVEKFLGCIASPGKVVEALRKDDFSVLPLEYSASRERLVLHHLFNTEFFAWYDKDSEKWRSAIKATYEPDPPNRPLAWEQWAVSGEHPYAFLCGADTYVGIHLGEIMTQIFTRLHELEKQGEYK